jgi:phenylpyruvate tautomerase PptA (4-oxalocrotonate tautomerase family)
MPLVRIELRAGKPAEYRSALAEGVYQAMRTALNVPADDRFIVVSEHGEGSLVVDPGYLGIRRTPDAIVVQVTLNEGRTLEMKRAFYRKLADELEARAGVRREDVMVSLVEVKKENWSFGNGEAQYAT